MFLAMPVISGFIVRRSGDNRITLMAPHYGPLTEFHLCSIGAEWLGDLAYDYVLDKTTRHMNEWIGGFGEDLFPGGQPTRLPADSHDLQTGFIPLTPRLRCPPQGVRPFRWG